jgi:O-antigen/teichoic acid export membrane protein
LKTETQGSNLTKVDTVNEVEVAHKLLVDFLKYSPSLLLPRLTALITVPIITRLFAPDVYGKYALTLAAVSLFSAISSGFAAALIRFLPANESSNEARNRFLSTLLLLTGIGVGGISGLLSLALWLSAPAWDQDLLSLMGIGLVLYVVDVAFLMLTAILRSWRRVGTYSILQLLQGYGSLGIGLLLVLLLDTGISGLLWGAIIVTTIASTAGWLWVIGNHPIRFRFSGELGCTLTRFAFFISVGNIVYWLLDLSDRWLLEFLRGSSEVGLYAVSYTLASKTMYIWIGAFSMSIQPLVTSIWEQKGRNAAEKFLGVATRWYLLLAVPIAVGLSVLAKPIVGLMASSQYEAGYVIVPLVVLSMLLYGLADIVGRGFVLNNRPEVETRNFFLAAITNVILNLLAIPRWGYVAAGFSTCVGYLILLILHVWSIRPYLTWQFPRRTFFNVVICCIAMALAVSGLYYIFVEVHMLWGLVVSVLAGIVIYLAGLIVLGEISSEVRIVLGKISAKGKRLAGRK